MEKSLIPKSIAARASLCVYCGQPANESCQFCGGSVCREHFNKTTGCCSKCVLGKRI